MNQNLTPVFRIGPTFDESGSFQPVGQLDNRVVPQNQPVRQLADGGPSSLRQPLERQQRLMLLGFEMVLAGLKLAEMQELPELKSKFRQILIIGYGDVHR